MRFLVIAEWDLTRYDVSIEELREWVRDVACEAYRGYPGVYLKCWYSNPEKERWGAVYLVSRSDALEYDSLPRTVGDATGPIGLPPDRLEWHLLECAVAGGERLMQGMSRSV